MIKKLLLISSLSTFFSYTNAQNGGVGINSTTPQGILHMQNTDSTASGAKQMGIVMPRVSAASKTVTPSGSAAVPATVVYDDAHNCLRVNQAGTWTKCLVDISTVNNLIDNIFYGGKLPLRARSISANYNNAVYINAQNNDFVYGMGDTSGYQLANVPYAVGTPTLILARPTKQVSTGYLNSVAVTNNGELWTWGYNPYGQLGAPAGTQLQVATKIALPGSVKAVMAYTGIDATLVLGDDKKVYAAGLRGYNLMADGNTSGYQATFAPITYFQTNNINVVSVYVLTGGLNGGYGAIDDQGNVYVWGYNGGNLGYPTNGPILAPTKLNLSGVLNTGEKPVKLRFSENTGGVLTDQGRFIGWGTTSSYIGGGTVGQIPPTNLTPSSSNSMTSGILGLNAGSTTGEKITDFDLDWAGGTVALVTNKGNIFAAGPNSSYKFGIGTSISPVLGQWYGYTPSVIPVGEPITSIELGNNEMYLTSGDANKYKTYGAGYTYYNALGLYQSTVYQSQLVLMFEQ